MDSTTTTICEDFTLGDYGLCATCERVSAFHKAIDPDNFGSNEFGHLDVGAEFRFSLGVENGLLKDLRKPGRALYLKTSIEGWESLTTGETGRVGSPYAKVWKES